MLLMLLSSSISYAQLTTVTKKDGRILATIKDVSVGMFNANSESVDANHLMDSFDITIHWRTLLGEPVEKYDFTWYSTGEFVYEGETITQKMLAKYPDLLKRFNNLQPYRVWVFIEGYQNPVFTSVSVPDFIYLVDHLKILQAKSGVKGDGIVGGSPHWNEFLDWEHNSAERFLNTTSGVYQKGSRSNQHLLKYNKNNFAGINKVTLKASLYKVEWHEYELKAIVERYSKYESGELSPDDTSDDLNDLLSGGGESDCGDDLNAMLSGCGEKAVEFEIETKDGKEGVVAKDGRILIPFKDWDITSFDPIEGLATIEKEETHEEEHRCFNVAGGTMGQVVEYTIREEMIVNSSGNSVIPSKKTASISWLNKTFSGKSSVLEYIRDGNYETYWYNFYQSCKGPLNKKMDEYESYLRSQNITNITKREYKCSVCD